MSTTTAARAAALITSGTIAVALGTGTAAAHVSADPEEAEQGGTAHFAFRVPNERDDASTVRIKVVLPEEQPLSSVRTAPVPGWHAELEKVRLPEPVEVADSQVTEAVRSITWTADQGAGISPDEFQEFRVSLGTLPTDTDQLVLPTAQVYDSGEIVNWDTPQDEGAPEPEHPAPALELTEESDDQGHSHGSGQASQTPPAGEEAAGQASTDDTTARVLGGAGLLVGALGLGIGLGALLRSRRNNS